MARWILFVLVAALSSPVFAEIPADHDGGEVPRARPAPKEEFRDVIPDQPVSLVGAWSDSEKQALRIALGNAAVSRIEREADIYEYTVLQKIVFKFGNEFSGQMDYEDFKNPGRIWGVGISSIETLTFTIPKGATAAQIGEFLYGKLPARLSRPPGKLEKFQRMTAKSLRPSVCDLILKLFQ